jgi:hypothetical protein
LIPSMSSSSLWTPNRSLSLSRHLAVYRNTIFVYIPFLIADLAEWVGLVRFRFVIYIVVGKPMRGKNEATSYNRSFPLKSRPLSFREL